MERASLQKKATAKMAGCSNRQPQAKNRVLKRMSIAVAAILS
jgi:hypothetical protein